jgi:hypothetical protein
MDSKKFGSVGWNRSRELVHLSELRRDTGIDWKTFAQRKEEENVSKTSNKTESLLSKLEVGKEEFYPLTKSEYREIVKVTRREQVHNLFLEEMEQVFQQLEERAMQMVDCHFEVSFDINEAYDIDKAEILLRDYFLDLGFDVIVAERNDEQSNEQKVVFTLT